MTQQTTAASAEIRPFTVAISDADLDDLRARLSNTRWPEEAPGEGWMYGAPINYIRGLAEKWGGSFDWRAVEARLNAYPQYTTTIDGQDIHFMHIRAAEPNALPLILTHGWPGSVVEYLDLIGPLTDPRAHGGDPTDAFDLVIPSIPGYGFSGPTHEAGWDRYRIARAWAELMRRLGYTRYGAHGNDQGSFISPEVGRVDQDHIVGVHVTQVFSFPSGDPAEFAGISEEEIAGLKRLEWFNNQMSAYSKEHATQPQTVAYALLDSPVGQLAWNGHLFRNDVDDEYILSNVSVYWFTRTSGSAARLYFEDAHAQHTPTEPTTFPMGVAMFANDFQSMRRFAERDHKNIVHWRAYDRGGHFAAHQVPELLSSDLREFFRGLR